MHRLILASASPRRKQLLQQIGLDPVVTVSSTGEDYDKSLSPVEITTTLANRKAADVAARSGGGLILGADTIVALGSRILGKPSSKEEAAEMLRMLSGKTHTVITGVALIHQDSAGTATWKRTFAEEVRVTFGTVAEEDIARYVDTGQPMDKAGAYGIQDAAGSLFVEKICGDYNAVVGLPLHALFRQLKENAPEYLSTLSYV